MNNENEIAIIWHIDDVREVRPDLTDEQARDVFYSVQENHDATIGVNWDVLSFWADHLYPVQHSSADRDNQACEEA